MGELPAALNGARISAGLTEFCPAALLEDGLLHVLPEYEAPSPGQAAETPALQPPSNGIPRNHSILNAKRTW